MAKLSVYEPPMCCSTGVCGPDGEDKLAQFASTLDWVKRSGHQVERYDLGHAPGAFAGNAFVKGMLEKEGLGVLPLVLVDGEILVKGDYPTREAVSRRLGAGAAKAGEPCCGGAKPEAKAAEACCAPAPAKQAAESACCAAPASAAAAKSSCC